ncbi:hypothetical protein LV89_03110 [Arcicella aurantiaca]|uniref:Uncharacterized protein n=1 Tax=Arcicella aurantiaca TaxID=591202 RepID=A0A316E2X4_9BACT|nr:hypothetical protein [Arcicella aurantiaca]PWK23902.1 hypothetical protein LV89_03110 [Arcicella aurantiaca]
MNFNKFFSTKDKEQELNEGLMMLEAEDRLEMIYLSTEFTDSLLFDNDTLDLDDEVMF